MKHFLFFLLFSISPFGFSQDPIKWNFSYDSNEQIATFTAILEEGWHLYSQTTKANSGPIATSFEFKRNEQLKLKGKTKEPAAIKVYDENFESDLKIFEHRVSFTQKLRTKDATSLIGSVTYMVCNATMCLPPVDENFEITITN